MPFDLIDEPWLLVDDGGVRREVSLSEAFTRAHEIRRVHGDVPSQAAAVLRLLLAILYRALPVRGSQADVLDAWEAWWAAPALPGAVQEYLREHRDGFDLFDPTHPFLQTAGLEAKGTSGLMTLVADVPPKSPFFTTRAGQQRERLSAAEAARWLVHCHAFDPSGIKTGAIGDERVKGGKGYPIGTGWAGNLGVVLVEGRNLKETLLLNLAPGMSSVEDRPVWEREPLTAAVEAGHTTPAGPADLLTWPSRRIRLIGDASGVRDVIRANGDPLAPVNQGQAEPYTAWRRSANQEKKLAIAQAYMPRTHSAERSLWRGLPTLLPPPATSSRGSDAQDGAPPAVIEWVATLRLEELLPMDCPLTIWAVGVEYGTQSSVITAMIDDRLAVSADLLATATLREIAREAVNTGERVALAVGDLARNLQRACGRDGEAARLRALEEAYHHLGEAFALAVQALGGGTDPVAWTHAWHAVVRRIADRIQRELVSTAPEAAFVGRDIEIASKGKPTRTERLDAGLAVSWFRLALHRHVPRPTPIASSTEQEGRSS